MTEICQTKLPVRPWRDPRLSRLPGLVPVDPGDWLHVDEVYAGQMARRRAVLKHHRDAVLRLAPAAQDAALELLECVLAELQGRDDFRIGTDQAVCPDGRRVPIDRGAPLETLNALVQEDFCILQKPDGADEHVLTGAILCFPASWSLDEKFMRPLIGIHAPVDEYDENIAKRVQRLFNGIQVSRPMWRANALLYHNPELFQPRRENDRRGRSGTGPCWVRSERQSLVRLERTGAVVFSIHTYVVPQTAFSPDDIAEVAARHATG